MALDYVTGAPSVTGSEYLRQIVEDMIEITLAVNNVIINKESFKDFSAYLERVVPIIIELNKKDTSHSESLNNAIKILNQEVKCAKQLTVECTKRNRIYLLMNCRNIIKNLERTTRELGRALDLLPLASLDLSSDMVEELKKLSEVMQRAEFKASTTEEEILEKIESGIQERNVDRSYANNLLAEIATAVGISTGRDVLKKELDEFKSEIENARLRKDNAEAIQMAQIIALLERADAASSLREKEMKYYSKRESLGSQPLEPLQSFYCPITRDVMVDPVETSSGQTFERSAIEKWLADGNQLCPLTITPLDASVIRPNKTLRQSINEWKDRNTIITIGSMKSKLLSEQDEEVIDCLQQLEDLCKDSDQHREWVILENYIPLLVKLLGSKNRDLRNHSLIILCILAKDSDDAKERVSRAENAIEFVVRSLGRRIGEGKLAVALLLELSKCAMARDCIGKAQGCILLLVTMSSSDDNQAATVAQELLEILSFSDQNVIQMAKANYFKHFLHLLSSGPEDVNTTLTSTLAEMELTDHNKAALLKGGVLGPLLHMVSNGNPEMKKVAVKAVLNLSSSPVNGLHMIREGAVRPLLDLLFRHSSPPDLRAQVAATIAHLTESTVSQGSSPAPVLLLESDDETEMLFSLVNLTWPAVQQNILRVFCALCQSPSASSVKTKLSECSALQVLVSMFERGDQNVRVNAVKLFSCLVEDGDEATIRHHVDQKCLETLSRIATSSVDPEEITSVMAILSNLPENTQITQCLLDGEAVPVISRILSNSKHNDPHRLVENAAGALCRFASPINLGWQKTVAEARLIPVLVQLLDSGTNLTKKYAAVSLGRLSKSSLSMTQPIPKRKAFWCFSAPPETGCRVHGGFCSVESSFCLVEANAIRPLVRGLQDPDLGVSEASLDALLTLIEGEALQSGTAILVEENVVPLIVKLLSCPFPTLQEKALIGLELLFRLPECRQKYGTSAQMHLVDITQRGRSAMKPLSARILAHLNILHDQSSYF